MLLRDIPSKVHSRTPWKISKSYGVRIMAARILAASSSTTATLKDLNHPPVVRQVRRNETQAREERENLLDRVRQN